MWVGRGLYFVWRGGGRCGVGGGENKQGNNARGWGRYCLVFCGLYYGLVWKEGVSPVSGKEWAGIPSSVSHEFDENEGD